MHNDGVILLQNDIEKIIENYYKESLNQDIYFRFFHIFYKTLGTKHSIYNYITHQWQEKNEIIYNYKSIPCIVKKSDYEFTVDQINMQKEINDIVNIDDLENIIESSIPSKLIRISYKNLNSILEKYGYGDVRFNFFRNPEDNIGILYKAKATFKNSIEQSKIVENKNSKGIEKKYVIKKSS